MALISLVLGMNFVNSLIVKVNQEASFFVFEIQNILKTKVVATINHS